MKKRIQLWLTALVVSNTICLMGMAVLGYHVWQIKSQQQSLLDGPSPALAFGSAQQSMQSSGQSSPQANSSSGLPKWDPFDQFHSPSNSDPFKDMHQRMQKMLESFASGNDWFSTSPFHSSPFDLPALGAGSPKITSHDKGDHFLVTISLPEGQNMEVSTEIENQQLHIRGKVQQSARANQSNGLSQAFSSSQFSQSITLPEPVDEAAMTVEHNGNQVEIKIPKRN